MIAPHDARRDGRHVIAPRFAAPVCAAAVAPTHVIAPRFAAPVCAVVAPTRGGGS